MYIGTQGRGQVAPDTHDGIPSFGTKITVGQVSNFGGDLHTSSRSKFLGFAKADSGAIDAGDVESLLGKPHGVAAFTFSKT